MMAVKKNKQSTFPKWMGPLLDALRQLGGSGRPKEVTNQVAKNLNIPDNILEETTKTGILKFYNQVAWARQYLVWEGLLESNNKGVWTLTTKGLQTTLSENQGREIFLKWVEINQKARKSKLEPTIIKEQEEDEHGFAAASGKCGDVTTQKIGNFYYDSDGGVTQKVGNFLYGPDGEVTQKIGNFYYHSDGTTTQRIGNFYYDSDGGVTQKIGNFYYRSGGKPCEENEE